MVLRMIHGPSPFKSHIKGCQITEAKWVNWVSHSPPTVYHHLSQEPLFARARTRTHTLIQRQSETHSVARIKHLTKLSQLVPQPTRVLYNWNLPVSAVYWKGRIGVWGKDGSCSFFWALCVINDNDKKNKKISKYLATIWSVTASSRLVHVVRYIIHNAAPRYAKICALGT